MDENESLDMEREDLGRYADLFSFDAVKPVRLSLHLIVKRHLPPAAKDWSHEEILEALHKVTHIRLDRENISEIDGLELLEKKVSNLYLQHNQIKCIENLECLTNLRFLTLSGNQIEAVEGLKHLQQLFFLDLSLNLIKDFDIDEFPQSLIILNLKGNPCTSHPDHRGRIIQDLPKLKQLDEVEVTSEEKLEAGFKTEEDDDDDDDDNFLYEQGDDSQEDEDDINATPLGLQSQIMSKNNSVASMQNYVSLSDSTTETSTQANPSTESIRKSDLAIEVSKCVIMDKNDKNLNNSASSSSSDSVFTKATNSMLKGRGSQLSAQQSNQVKGQHQ